jgi:hypothetical protein
MDKGLVERNENEGGKDTTIVSPRWVRYGVRNTIWKSPYRNTKSVSSNPVVKTVL